MKSVVAVLSLLLPAWLAFGASPGEGARFLAAVRTAYTTTNIAAIMDLHCWDGVDTWKRSRYPKILSDDLRGRKIDSVRYILSPELAQSSTNNGVVYVPNLVPVKWIKIEFEPTASASTSLELAVGEKEGKLMIVSYIPQRP